MEIKVLEITVANKLELKTNEVLGLIHPNSTC